MRLSTFLALAALGLTASALPAAAGTLLVPQQFPTIQKALNAAKPYDTVLVSVKPKGGVYNEALTITTPNLVLQGQGNPVIDGTGLGTLVPQPPPFQPYTVYPSGIEIRAGHVAVRGLTVQNMGGSQLSNSSGINVGYFSDDFQTEYSFGGIEISGCTLQKDFNGLTISGFAGPNPVYGSGGANLKGYTLVNTLVTKNVNSGASVGGDFVLVAGNLFTANNGPGLTVSGTSVAVLGNQSTGNGADGVDAYGTSLLVAGNSFTGNGLDGADVSGDGLAVSGNEAASNGYTGLSVQASDYNPAVKDPQNPNPAPSAAVANSLHDNGHTGLAVAGTVAASGNTVSHNAGYGLYLNGADYATVSANLVSGTTFAGLDNRGGPNTDGAGIYVDSFLGASGPLGLTLTGNQVTGCAGDGIFLASVTAARVSRNSVLANKGIGIHLSDYPSAGDVPNTVTLNVAQRNGLDARDDSSATGTFTYGNGVVSTGDAGQYGPSINIWTKNLFGTTDPVGLSK